MTLTVACHPFHRCGCVSVVIGLDLAMLTWRVGDGGTSSEGCRKQGRNACTESQSHYGCYLLTLGAL